MSNKVIYQIHAEMYDYRLKGDECELNIWRRFQVNSDITLAQLGYIIQVLFEMTASHLMKFEVQVDKTTYIEYKIPDEETDWMADHNTNIIELFNQNLVESGLKLGSKIKTIHKDATKILLKNVLSNEGGKLDFEYDFGDSWKIELTLEKIFTDNALSSNDLPRVLEGNAFGIIEDVGGMSGLDEFVRSFKKKKGKKYKEYSEWLGTQEYYNWIDFNNFDMNGVDLDDLNFRIKNIPQIYKNIYEKRKVPSEKSINLINRSYKRKYGWLRNIN